MTYEDWIERFLVCHVATSERAAARLALQTVFVALVTQTRSRRPKVKS